jgi:hypothetical protein
MKKTKLFSIAGLAACAVLALNLSSCSDDATNDSGTAPIGGYNTSDEIASGNLVAKFSFEDNVTDAKGNITGGNATGTSFVAGAKGKAWQGATAGYVLYTSVGSKITAMQSTTISSWVKTSAHADGAESWFQLLNDSNWIGNLFILQESGAAGNDSTRIKFTVNNWNATAWKEQWTDLGTGANRMKIGNDAWHHVVCSYDASTSKVAMYVDGVKMNLPASVTDKFQDDPAKGGAPLGALAFKNATKFVFGCYKQHLPGGTPDAWMKNYDGGLDEFRIYDKALADSDVSALYQLEKAGR